MYNLVGHHARRGQDTHDVIVTRHEISFAKASQRVVSGTIQDLVTPHLFRGLQGTLGFRDLWASRRDVKPRAQTHRNSPNGEAEHVPRPPLSRVATTTRPLARTRRGPTPRVAHLVASLLKAGQRVPNQTASGCPSPLCVSGVRKGAATETK